MMMIRRTAIILFACTLALGQAHAAEKLVTVTGEATVAVAPDTAMIRIGVTSQDKTAREAGEVNAKQMTAVLAAIKEASIADRDIQTSRLSLQPQFLQQRHEARLGPKRIEDPVLSQPRHHLGIGSPGLFQVVERARAVT